MKLSKVRHRDDGGSSCSRERGARISPSAFTETARKRSGWPVSAASVRKSTVSNVPVAG